MTTIVLSTAIFPNIDYMAAMAGAEAVWIEHAESYARRSYRSRYDIAGPQGRLTLSLPVHKPVSNNCPVVEVRVAPDDGWVKDHIKSLETAYNSSPFFLYYRDELLDFQSMPGRPLVEVNREVLQQLREILEVETPLFYTSEYKKDYAEELDLRQRIHPRQTAYHREFPPYYQVFNEADAFEPNLSVLDAIFNLGPEAGAYVQQLSVL